MRVQKCFDILIIQVGFCYYWKIDNLETTGSDSFLRYEMQELMQTDK